ncbi:peptidase M23-like protein [Novosphingobium kunmingense]|uniref:Peptidase M23-like protein n=2 Tax=Novosphingobium kunmingense TaxID=1211806 RepID=A0A2N0HL07_9SPHN|nr:peptidase M23-like protein [Novosphingobium kunmingense]
MVRSCAPARLGRFFPVLLTAWLLPGAHVAMARAASEAAVTEAADADADWGEEPAATPVSPITVGRALDLVGRPIDIVASTRRRDALEAAALGIKPLLGGGILPRGMPVRASYISSGFGLRTHPVLGALRGHSGVDLPAAAGSPIRATLDGMVASAGWRGGYGLAVQIDHGKGIASRYAHMSRMAVYPGQAVRKGDVIGYVGSTGLSTGPHLHYEIRVNGAAVNPYNTLR